MPPAGPPMGSAAPTELGASVPQAAEGLSESEAATLLGSRDTAAPRARERMVLRPGTMLGRYRLGVRLGAGAMGAVYEAHDPALDRPVAIKVLHAELPESARRRMKQEALILARLSHPNVVEIYETIHAPDQTLIVMPLVRGQTLACWRERDPPPAWPEAVRVYLEAGAGLAAAHAAGFLHRDFKPGNCILGDDGRVRVLDFGVATALGAEALAAITTGDEPGSDLAATRLGAFVGTPAYVAPEQALHEGCDARADQYSFCVALYEAVYGERPIEADSIAALLHALDRGEIRPPPAGRSVPAALRRVLLRGLQREPGRRWPSMDALLAALRRVVEPRRRWVVPLALAGALAPAVGVWLTWGGAADPRCEAEPPPLRAIWDDARREEVEAAVRATALPYAPSAWTRIEHDLDAYASAWSLAHAELCGAIRANAEATTEATELRMRCLQERRVALQETVEVFAAADATRVEKAVPLLDELPALSRCDDVDALRSEQAPALDPAVAARLEAVHAVLRRSDRLGALGEFDEGLQLLEQLRPEIDALDRATLRAELAQREGKMLNEQGRYGDAAPVLEQGYLLAVEHGLDPQAARTARVLASAMAHLTRLDEALQWGRTALARTRGVGLDPIEEALALREIGNIHHARGELDEALEHQRQALAILEQEPSPPYRALALTLEAISMTLRDDSQFDAALDHQRRALALYEQTLGPAHPYTGTARVNLATVLEARGELQQATEELREAAAIFEDARGPGHPHVGAAWANLGEVLRQQGRLDDARESFERALRIFEQAYGPTHPDTAKVLSAIGTVLATQGRLDESLAYQRRALAVIEETLGPRHALAGHLHNNLGALLLSQGQHDEALESFRRAVAIIEETLGPDHPRVAGPLNNVAILLFRRGETEDAHALLLRVLEIKERGLGDRHPDLVPTLIVAASVALERRDPAAAGEHAEHALAILEASEGSPATLANARWVAARAAWRDPTQRARARVLAKQARDGYAALGDAYREQAAEISAWLADPE